MIHKFFTNQLPIKKLLLCGLVLLTSCSQSEFKKFSIDCDGNKTDFTNTNTLITKEKRSYIFDENFMKEKNCVIENKQVTCLKEYQSGPKTITRERIIYSLGNYSFSELIQVVGIDESKNLPMFIKSQTYQSSCPMKMIY